MKKSNIFCVLACAVLLSGCSTGYGLKEAHEKLLNTLKDTLQTEESEQGSEDGLPKKEPTENNNTNPEQRPQPKKEKPEPRQPHKPKREQPGKQTVEPEAPTGEPEPQNTLTPEKTEPPEPVKFEEFQLPPMPVLKFNPNFLAPEKFQHPLQTSDNLVFMLGQDKKGNYLYSEGAITDGAYKKFIRYVAHFAEKGIKLDRLMMHSPGGMLAEGIQIGQFVRENQWTTDLDQHMRCYSSCAMIYAAGVEKRMQTGAEVGFHRPYIPSEPDTPELIEQVYQDYQPYWKYVQGDPALYDDFMKNYGRDDMLVLTTETATKHMKIEKY
ncbi:hypothetical protein [Endozoicomonas ascidiicola]|uniref:hypothetical protein n=1 Tax=Endozoicomonas ascidiicola TaxID=1698521 RepID=UPI0008301A03|nr:hypothetical protein [Endozoicomonas ascidiicola]